MLHFRPVWIPAIPSIGRSCAPEVRCFPSTGYFRSYLARAAPAALAALVTCCFLFSAENRQASEGTRVCLSLKGKYIEAIMGTCSFPYGTYPGYVRDWCAESGQACSASRGRGQ